MNLEHDVLLSGILVFLPLKSGSSLRQITVSFCTVQRAENRVFQTGRQRDRKTDRYRERETETETETQREEEEEKGKEKRPLLLKRRFRF